MFADYLTINHINTKTIKRLFTLISINPDISWNDTPCWIWNRTLRRGYGYFNYRHKREQSHRFMYAWLVAPIPRGIKQGELDHLCRNRACCNPCHLQFVTGATNKRRGNSFSGMNHRKTHCNYGHELSGRNLGIESRGRFCRKCKVRHSTEWKKRKELKSLTNS